MKATSISLATLFCLSMFFIGVLLGIVLENSRVEVIIRKPYHAGEIKVKAGKVDYNVWYAPSGPYTYDEIESILDLSTGQARMLIYAATCEHRRGYVRYKEYQVRDNKNVGLYTDRKF